LLEKVIVKLKDNNSVVKYSKTELKEMLGLVKDILTKENNIVVINKGIMMLGCLGRRMG